ncbi:50S ribosomal protein L17 [Bacteroidota bacterium]
MRHGKKFNHLGRKTAHRKAMLANMACSLIEHKRINTTEAKAKALRQYVEPIITKSKNDTTHNRRNVFSVLKNKYAVTELFKEISVKVADRPGGYVRIIKLGNRQGDNAPMAMVELVDYNEVYNPNGAKKKKSTRRGRKKADDAAVVETVEAPAAEESKSSEE